MKRTTLTIAISLAMGLTAFSAQAEEVGAHAWEHSGNRFVCTAYLNGGGGAVLKQTRAGQSEEVWLALPRSVPGDRIWISAASPSWHPRPMNEVPLGEALVKGKKAMISGLTLERVRDAWSEGFDVAIKTNQGATMQFGVQGLSSTQAAYDQCVDELLPSNFAQIEFSSFAYEAGETRLTSKMKQKLDEVIEYFYADTEAEGIVVDAHADDGFSRLIHRDLSRKRAELVVDYLVQKGLTDAQLVLRFHGQSYPISEDASKNRRVAVKIEKEPFRTKEGLDEMDVYENYNQVSQILKGEKPEIFADEPEVFRYIEADEIIQQINDRQVKTLGGGTKEGAIGLGERQAPGQRGNDPQVDRTINQIESANSLDADDFENDKAALEREFTKRGFNLRDGSQEVEAPVVEQPTPVSEGNFDAKLDEAFRVTPQEDELYRKPPSRLEQISGGIGANSEYRETKDNLLNFFNSGENE